MKNCINCYREIPDDSIFCPYCGVRQYAEQNQSTGQEEAQESAQQTAGQASGESGPQTGQWEQSQQTSEESGPQNCGQYTYQASCPGDSSEPPVNWVPYLVLAIISTVCCCPPFGIVAIVYAARINNAIIANDSAEAQRAAGNARIWLIVAYAVGILMWIFYLISQIGFWAYDAF